MLRKKYLVSAFANIFFSSLIRTDVRAKHKMTHGADFNKHSYSSKTFTKTQNIVYVDKNLFSESSYHRISMLICTDAGYYAFSCIFYMTREWKTLKTIIKCASTGTASVLRHL